MIDEHAAAATGAADGDPEAVIVLDNVRKEFGSFVAVEQADFAIRRGEFFSLLGPSGCGKTTLLKMIAGFEQPTNGPGRARRRRRVARAAVPAQRQHGVPAVRAVPAHDDHRQRRLRAAGEEGPGGRGPPAGAARCSTSSGSASSPTAARASSRAASSSASPWPGRWSNLPAALLLDEPLAALDLKLREAMQLELKRIQREVGITFIFVTHDQGEALTMSDRIAVMSRGRVEQIGTPEEIYEAPASIFVAGFIGSANLLPGAPRRCDVGRTGRRARLRRASRTARRRRRRDGRSGHGDAAPGAAHASAATPPGDGRSLAASSRTSSSRARDAAHRRARRRHRGRSPRSRATTSRPGAPTGRRRSRCAGRPARRTCSAAVRQIVGATTTDVDEVQATIDGNEVSTAAAAPARHRLRRRHASGRRRWRVASAAGRC